MPSTYIASADPANTSSVSQKMDDDEENQTRAISPIPNLREEIQQLALSPKTPEDIQKIPRDESFKTCKAAAEPTPHSRREGLRKTPARMSIFSGGKPFKEAASSNGKKFNSRRKKNTSQNHLANDTCNSNETFVKCEQELQFEHDSLEGPESSVPKRRDAAKPLTQQQLYQQQQPEPLFESELELPQINKEIVESSPKKQPVDLPQVKVAKKLSPRKQTPKPLRRSPKKLVTNNNETSKQMPPPRQIPIPLPMSRVAKPAQSREQLLKQNQRQQNKARRESQAIRNQFLTPKLPTFRKPPSSVISTASRYMNSFNTSRLTRSSSFKSTAELERDYFSSLRSF